jgi:outer membrane receptor protein involved in Fe transport
MLSEIVVTALKQKQSVLTIPTGITVLSAESLLRGANFNLADYISKVPGLNMVSGGPGQSEVFVRGVSSGFAVASSPSVAVYVNDTPVGSETANAMGNVTALDLDPALLRRVEVLKGPQGTIYGATAVGGLIRYVTVQPSLSEFSGSAEVGASSVYGGNQGYALRGMVDGPLVPGKLGLLVSGFHRSDPGYISDPYRNIKNVNGVRTDGGLIEALWQPTPRFTAQLMLLIQDMVAGGTNYEDLNANLNPIYGPYEQVAYLNELWLDNENLYSLKTSYKFPWATLTSITSYEGQSAEVAYDYTGRLGQKFSTGVGVPNSAVADRVGMNHHRITEEVRLSTPDDNKLVWLGGLFYTHEWNTKAEVMDVVDKVTGLNVRPTGQPALVDTVNDSFTEYAAYLNASYHFTKQLNLRAGVRYTRDIETAFTPFSGVLIGPPEMSAAHSESQPVTFLVSPSYKFRHSMIYARISTGFRPGGPTGVTNASVYQGAPATYQPDKLTSYEIGYKADFPRQRVTVQVDGYDIEWSKMQVLSIVNGFYLTGNAGKARVVGSEFSGNWMPIDGLNLSIDSSYTHGYLTANAPGISAFSGEDLPDVPLFSGRVGAEYDAPLSSGFGSWFIGAHAQYVGARVSDFITGIPVGIHRPTMPSYYTGGIYSGIRHHKITLEVYVKNLGNAMGFTRLWQQNPNDYSAPYDVAVIPPRTIGFSISTRF